MINKQTYRNLTSLVYLFIVCSAANAQTDIFNLGQEITIISGTSITVRGDYTHDVKDGKEADIANAGEIRLEKNLINNTSNTIFSTPAGRVEFYGDSLQEIISDTLVTFNSLEVNKPEEELQLQTEIQVLDSLILSEGNLHMNSRDIELSSTGTLYGETDTSRLYGVLSYVYADPFLGSVAHNISGLGLSIENSIPLGTTQITRAHDAQGGASNGSIKRYFKIDPLTTNQTPDKVMMTYLDTTEVGTLDEAKFSLWVSNNNGLVWYRQTSVPLAGGDSVIATTVPFDANEMLITLAESECDSLPVVDLGADTMYLCETDTLLIDAKNKGLFFEWNTLETTQTIKVTTAGAYAVAVTDANGCVGVDTTEVILKPYPVLSFSTESVCQNDSTVFVNESTISQDTIAYFWDFGDTKILSDTSIIEAPTYTFDTSGVYTTKLIIVSEYGCTVDSTLTAIVHPNPAAAFSATNVCIDSVTAFTNNSQITSGGMLYKWDFGDLTVTSDTSETASPNYTYLSDGNYTAQLIATSNAGCLDTLQQQVIVHPRPVPDFSFVEVGENSSIQLENLTTINSGNISYDWDFGDGVTTQVEEPTKSYTSFGNYTILLKAESDFSCYDTLSKVIQISDIPTASFTVKDTCAFSTVTFDNTTVVNGGAGLTFEWKFGDGSTSSDSIPVKTYANEGTYTVWLIATSSAGNIDSVSQSVTIHPNPTMDFTYSNECKDERVSIVNKSFVTTGFNQYAWSFGDGQTSSFGSPNTTYSDSGDYIIQLIATTDNGCIDTLEQTVTIYPLPVVDFGGVITTCGDSIVLDAENAGSTYLWNTSSTAQVITAKTSGEYTVTVTSENFCQYTDKVEVSLNSQFAPSLGADRSVCVTTTLDAGNPGSKYVWNTGVLGDTLRTLAVETTGEYIVDITDQNNCLGSDTVLITVNDNPIVDLGNDTTVCSGNSVTVDAGNIGATYDWSTGAETRTIEVDQTGSYSVIVTDNNNCSASAAINLGLFSLPVVSLGDDQSVCESIVLLVNNSGASYLWSDASTEDSLLVNQAGTYWVEVTNGNACKSRDTIVIGVLPKPIVDLGNDQAVCNNETVILDAGTDGNKYLWNTGATSQFLFATATGSYKVTLTNSDNCSSSASVNVTVLDQVEVYLGQDFTLCAGKEVTLDAENTGATYKWGSNTSTSFGTDQTIDISEAGSFWVEVTTGENCIGSDTIKIGMTSNTVEAAFLATSLVDVGDTIQFLELASPDSIDYIWNFGDGVISEEQDPLHAYFVANTYSVSLTVSNELCSDQVIKDIVVRDKREVIVEPEIVSFFEIVEFSAYPNPIEYGQDLKYIVRFSESEQGYITLYDLSGRIVFDELIEGNDIEGEIPLDDKSSGMYILKLIVKNQSRYIRLEKL